MNDQELQRRVRQHLNASAHALPSEISTRLHQARQKALSRQKVAVPGLSLAGVGQMITSHLTLQRKTALATVCVLLLTLGTGLLGEWQHAADMEEVDSALLADDLPIDAYLDRGFDAWVQNDTED
ncbi:DUF3619 family protein [Zoogloea sp.]|uniref:DUF3619 family protein n=1 Tax=Zoogloea sp. TaxID=49181 RepID=UPI002634E6E6|nr:DUF3619 family protein [Zoogloea sp.]MDD3354268.1 DUF3619 family protein [Zoogloea sp.]